MVRQIAARELLPGAHETKENGRPEPLVGSYRRLAEVYHQVLSAQCLDTRLEHLAQTDSLTGLYNHRYFHERLRSELTRASRSHDPVAVLMFDLDDFKRVNDVYGHGAGDQLLVQISRLALETVRGSDVVCRIGGAELGASMPSCHAGDAP